MFGDLACLHSRKHFVDDASPSHEAIEGMFRGQRMFVAFVMAAGEAYYRNEPSYLVHGVDEHDLALESQLQNRKRSSICHCFPAHSIEVVPEVEVVVG